MRNSAFHQANATVAALSAKITSLCNHVVESINSLSLTTQDQSTPPPAEDYSSLIPDHQANATMSNQNALLIAIQDLQNQIRTLSANQADGTHSGRITRTRNENNCCHNNTSMYCWTRG
mmetsp:Transcript_14421/g.20579  ORF Transcript_14421/g.20579 Transcript_14421/m.20579 type:complete len:119 (+) Transcript_14421:1002-1358(+)